MTPKELKEIADTVNEPIISTYMDRDPLGPIFIEMQNAAEDGEYSLDYIFLADVQYCVVLTIANELIELGYEVEIILEKDSNNEQSYGLSIYWTA